MDRPVSLHTARLILQRWWGHDDFHYHQRRAILAALRGRDCLAVLPTGGGKSLCYQIPGLVRPGLTVIVSPLVSLMQDQVAALRARHLPAAYVAGDQPRVSQEAVWSGVRSGRVKLLYVAPERLRQTAERVGRRPVGLLAVDEAHCISEWGHEFRPTYRGLGQYVQVLGTPPVMAVTATATPATRWEIVRSLRLKRPVMALRSFDRPNLWLGVRCFANAASRLGTTARMLRRVADGVALVYAPTRHRTDDVAAVLRWWGIRAWPYHAGLPAHARRRLLYRFRCGELRVVVATSAFGMGIDRPDVRLVIHLGLPVRPEAYYQQAGRAGRDGEPAACWLFWEKGDLRLASRLAARGGADGPGTVAARESRARALATMERYVRGRQCRRRALLAYLGESLSRCAGCDRCARRGIRDPLRYGSPTSNR